MPYYIRLITKSNEVVTAKELASALMQMPGFELVIEADGRGTWSEMLLRKGSVDLCVLTRESDEDPGSLCQEELEEFQDEILDAHPQSAVHWLEEWLQHAHCISAFQILGGVKTDADWNAVYALRDVLLGRLGGIIQADGEGFSNEHGHHILWQFSDDVKGDWGMAVLDKAGHWRRFRMDLGNTAHREAFWRGEVPAGVIEDNA
jgi:hypothetical protein